MNGGPADPILSRGPLTERETLVIFIFLIFYCVAGFAQDRLTSRQPTIEGPSVKWALHLIDIVDGLDCTGDASRSDDHQVELERDVSTANRLPTDLKSRDGRASVEYFYSTAKENKNKLRPSAISCRRRCTSQPDARSNVHLDFFFFLLV